MKSKGFVTAISMFETGKKRRDIDDGFLISFFKKWKESLCDNLYANNVDVERLFEIIRWTTIVVRMELF